MSREIVRIDRTADEAQETLRTFAEGVSRLAERLGVDSHAVTAHALYAASGRVGTGSIAHYHGCAATLTHALRRAIATIERDDHAPEDPMESP